MVLFGLVLFEKPEPNETEPFLSTLENIPFGLGWVGFYKGKSDNIANTGQLQLELSLSFAKRQYAVLSHDLAKECGIIIKQNI